MVQKMVGRPWAHIENQIELIVIYISIGKL